jgi:hypothetical protein
VFQGSSFDEFDELLLAIEKISRRVNRKTLDAVAQEGMTRWQSVLMKRVNMMSDA